MYWGGGEEGGDPTIEKIIIQSSHHNFCFRSRREITRKTTHTKANTVTETVVAVAHG